MKEQVYDNMKSMFTQNVTATRFFRHRVNKLEKRLVGIETKEEYVRIVAEYLNNPENVIKFGPVLCRILMRRYGIEKTTEKETIKKIKERVKESCVNANKPDRFCEDYVFKYLDGEYKVPLKREKIFILGIVLNLELENIEELLEKGCLDTGINYTDYKELVAVFCIIEQVGYKKYVDLVRKFEEKVVLQKNSENNKETKYFEEYIKDSVVSGKACRGFSYEERENDFLNFLIQNSGSLKGYSRMKLLSYYRLYEDIRISISEEWAEEARKDLWLFMSERIRNGKERTANEIIENLEKEVNQWSFVYNHNGKYERFFQKEYKKHLNIAVNKDVMKALKERMEEYVEILIECDEARETFIEALKDLLKNPIRVGEMLVILDHIYKDEMIIDELRGTYIFKTYLQKNWERYGECQEAVEKYLESEGDMKRYIKSLSRESYQEYSSEFQYNDKVDSDAGNILDEKMSILKDFLTELFIKNENEKNILNFFINTIMTKQENDLFEVHRKKIDTVFVKALDTYKKTYIKQKKAFFQKRFNEILLQALGKNECADIKSILNFFADELKVDEGKIREMQMECENQNIDQEIEEYLSLLKFADDFSSEVGYRNYNVVKEKIKNVFASLKIEEDDNCDEEFKQRMENAFIKISHSQFLRIINDGLLDQRKRKDDILLIPSSKKEAKIPKDLYNIGLRYDRLSLILNCESKYREYNISLDKYLRNRTEENYKDLQNKRNHLCFPTRKDFLILLYAYAKVLKMSADQFIDACNEALSEAGFQPIYHGAVLDVLLLSDIKNEDLNEKVEFNRADLIKYALGLEL